jgi:hypothetical protein
MDRCNGVIENREQRWKNAPLALGSVNKVEERPFRAVLTVSKKSSSRDPPGAKRGEGGGTLRFAVNYDPQIGLCALFPYVPYFFGPG